MRNKLNDNIWINIDDLMKNDALFTIAYGARGAGKTYGSLKYGINEYKKTGKGFIYLRRFKSEIKSFNTMFRPLINNGELEGLKYEINSKKQLVDTEKKRIIAQAQTLANAVSKKSSDFSDTGLIIFDEFILEKSSLHYIQDEFDLFIGFVETVSRMREITENQVVKIIMLANSASRVNPYFINFNVPLLKMGDIYKKEDLLVYYTDTDAYKREKLKTRFGKFINNHTHLNSYILDGKFNERFDFIARLPKKTLYVATLKYKGKYYGVFADVETRELYISDKYNLENGRIYALTNNDNTPNILLLSSNDALINRLVTNWKFGALKFTDIKIQNIFTEILNIL